MFKTNVLSLHSLSNWRQLLSTKQTDGKYEKLDDGNDSEKSESMVGFFQMVSLFQ
jgi:hypothetical protein